MMLKNLYQPFAAAMLGVALMFAFAPFNIFPLAVLAPAGLCALIYHATPGKSFWHGFYFGLGLFGSGVYWIFISISRYGDVPDIVAFFITAGLISILALFPAAACYLTNRYFNHDTRTKIVYAFPALWVLTEWVRSWFFSGFPWLLIGYSQTNSPLKGIAPIFSVYGVSLAVMMTSGLIVNGVMALRKNNFRDVYINLFTAVIIWTVGGLLALIPWTQPFGKPITVSLIQGNIPQSLKWDPENIELSFKRYREMTDPLWGKSDLIIWPEVAIPMSLTDAQDFVNELSAKAVANQSQLIFGIPVQATTEDGYYNAVLAVGAHEAAYIKRQLVPFGEYVPMQKYVARIFDFMNVPMSNTIPGHPFQPPMNLGDIKIQTSVCYEVAYPELSRITDKSINLLLTVTNDAWFNRSTAQAQHLQMAAMRAIEMGRPELFVSNDGITAIINAKGKIEKTAPAHVTYVLQGSVQGYTGFTPWMRNGLDPLMVIILVMLFTSYRSQRRVHNLHQAKAQHSKIKI